MATVSIITITYNAERFLERTIESVLRQTATDYEYIIVDGSSADSTMAIVRRYAPHVTRWISEPDRGLYDAMNKGLHLATGDYVWFMNAGDELYNDETLASLLAQIQQTQADIYYSDALFVQENGSPVGLRSVVTPHRLPTHLNWNDMALGMKVCHQAFVAKRKLAPDYDIHNLSADLDWEIKCLKKASLVEYLPFVLCKYLVGGLSVQQHRRSLTDRFKVLVTHFGWVPTVLNHAQISWRAWRSKKNGL
jgi:glycosyltransferase involved in cell wall biosynthesis